MPHFHIAKLILVAINLTFTTLSYPKSSYGVFGLDEIKVFVLEVKRSIILGEKDD